MNRIWKFMISVILIIIGIILYARFIGTMGLETKEYAIYDKNLPSGFDGIKICAGRLTKVKLGELSDLFGKAYAQRIKNAIDRRSNIGKSP